MNACTPGSADWKPYVQGHLARELRDARTAVGISQDAIATCLGLHHSSISEIERARSRMADDRVVEIERFLGCRPGRLMEAAIRDRGGAFIAVADEEQTAHLAALVVMWRAPSAERAAKIDEIRAGVQSGALKAPKEKTRAGSTQLSFLARLEAKIDEARAAVAALTLTP